MALQQARKKKDLFQIQIRRSHRQKIFGEERKNLLNMLRYSQVNNAMSQFLRNKLRQVPEICVQEFEYIQIQSVGMLIQMMEMEQVVQFEDGNQKSIKWYLDCNSINNIRFMSKLCRTNADFLGYFFQGTLLANRRHNQLFENLELRLRDSKCLFEANGRPENDPLRDLESQHNKYRVVALLQFWGMYFDHSNKHIQIQDFKKVLQLFQVFAEFSNIFYQRGTYIFISKMTTYIINMKIFQNQRQGKIVIYPIATYCKKFIINIQARMPFIIKNAVDYNCLYYQIAEILLDFCHISESLPGIFLQCLCTCNYINPFLQQLLRSHNCHEVTKNRLMAIKVINQVAISKNSIQIFYFEGVINITKLLAFEIIYQKQLQMACAFVLYNLVLQDQGNYLMKAIELMDFQKLINNIYQGNQKDVFQFAIKSIQVYQKSTYIHKKLLDECNLQEKIRHFSRQSKNNEVYQGFMRLIKNNVGYYIENFPKMMKQIYIYAKQNVLDQQNLIQQLEQQLQQNIRQMDL